MTLDAALRAAGIGGVVTAVTAVAPIVSPMCRAADWTCHAVTTEDDACFVKLREPDASDFVTVRNAASGARAAAARGVGPRLRYASDDAMVFDLLAPPWREARLHDLDRPEIIQAVLAAKRAIHTGPALTRRWDVFAEIDALAGPGAPADLLDAVSRLEPDTLVPCHNDGTVCNVMLHPDGGIRLVDFDCAGMADPQYDIGVMLNEACSQPAEWEAGIEMAFGRFTKSASDRCRRYAIADDLFWGLWGLSRHAASPRTGLEFLKYGRWRLLRCRMALGL